jgi:osmotically-inducible protein OsmY
MTSKSQRDQARSGDWQGLVVPYRYYGPGYAGVGYYAIYYQGGSADDAEIEDDERRSSSMDRRQVNDLQRPAAGEAQMNAQRQARGGFAGRGPRGYQRSDERIREEINDRLTEHDQLDASNLEVSVKDGEVTLTGSVDDRRDKRLAEEIAEKAQGVRDVMNQVKVSQRGQAKQESMSSGTSGSSARTTSSGTTSSRSRTKTASGQGKTSATSARSESREPVGAGVGGARDGAAPNGRPTTSEDDERR